MEGKTILVVEDDSILRKFIGEILKREYEILEAPTYSAAVEQISNQIDLALIDYVLPDGNGLELVKAFISQKHSLPVILMTAYNHEDVILKALRAGVKDYIKKPFTVSDLRRRVSDLLGVKGIDENSENADVEGRKEFIIDGLTQYISENYMNDLTLDDLSSMACMDKYSFCKAFKERTGKSFITFLNHVRIRHAAELLRNKDLNITDIAFFVGYGSVEHFNRTFRSAIGVSPRDYRKKIVSGIIF